MVYLDVSASAGETTARDSRSWHDTTVRDRWAGPDVASSRRAPPGAAWLDASRDRTLLKPAGAGLAGLMLGSVAGGDRDLLVARFQTVVLTRSPYSTKCFRASAAAKFGAARDAIGAATRREDDKRARAETQGATVTKLGCIPAKW